MAAGEAEDLIQEVEDGEPTEKKPKSTLQYQYTRQLSILQCNINGLCSTATKIKLEEIMEIAEKQKIQIIALQETKLNEKYNLKYKNYNILRKDRNKEGGGLAFLIKNLYYEDIAINIPNTSDLEAQGIKVYLNQNKTINIFNMYHPPNNKLIDDGTMAQFLTDNTIIVGDLNAKHQLWGCSTPNPRGKILSNLFDDNAFMCLNDGNPTHHSYSYNTAQALDISFSSPDIFHKCKWQILKSIGSDHLPILIEISTKTKTSSIKEKFWNFKKANWNLYQQNTNEDFRKAPTRIKDMEQNWISFKNTIIKAAKVSIPRGNIKKWIPNYTHQAKDIQTLITKRNELQKKYTQNQTNCRTELNIVNAKIKRLYVNMKREKWKQTCENLNPRNPNTKLWHLAKQIDRAQPQTENTNMIKNIDGTPATNDKNAANLLGNSYQISSKIKFEIKDKKVEKKARKIIHDCKNVTSTYNIFHEKINMKELDYALENTDLNKTPGPDGIHGQMISNLGKNGKEKLLDIFNNSWKTGKLPQDWKTATIIPIKKLDKSADDPKNYRPISLTSICCKLMEKIILRRLTYHLDTRNLLPEEQYGFRKGHGTIDQLLFFTQKGRWCVDLFGRSDDRIDEEEEPEWFSSGPTSQSETIELVGFDSDDKRFRRAGQSSRRSLENMRRPSTEEEEVPPPSHEEVVKSGEQLPKNEESHPSDAPPESGAGSAGAQDFDLNQILQMDWLPDMLMNGCSREKGQVEGPATSSRFSRWFKSESPEPEEEEGTKDLVAQVLNGIGDLGLTESASGGHHSWEHRHPPPPQPHSGNNILEVLQSANLNIEPLLLNTDFPPAPAARSVEELEAGLKKIVLNKPPNPPPSQPPADTAAFNKL
ncbi:hypothetical protein LAZ67_1003928, partial [Cordylochernes scorpioides]